MSAFPNVSLQATQREMATAINFLLNNGPYPFQRLSAAPASPKEGATYYDLTTHKAMVWDGSAWNALW